MVKMANHMDCKCVHLTITMIVHSMAAILWEIGQPRYAVLAYIYWTSMWWSYDSCQNKVYADQYHLTMHIEVACFF